MSKTEEKATELWDMAMDSAIKSFNSDMEGISLGAHQKLNKEMFKAFKGKLREQNAEASKLIDKLCTILGFFEEMAWDGCPRRREDDVNCLLARTLIKQAQAFIKKETK